MSLSVSPASPSASSVEEHRALSSALPVGRRGSKDEGGGADGGRRGVTTSVPTQHLPIAIPSAQSGRGRDAPDPSLAGQHGTSPKGRGWASPKQTLPRLAEASPHKFPGGNLGARADQLSRSLEDSGVVGEGEEEEVEAEGGLVVRVGRPRKARVGKKKKRKKKAEERGTSPEGPLLGTPGARTDTEIGRLGIWYQSETSPQAGRALQQDSLRDSALVATGNSAQAQETHVGQTGRGPSARETSPRGQTGRGPSARETSPRGQTGRGPSARETSPRGQTARETSPRGQTGRGASASGRAAEAGGDGAVQYSGGELGPVTLPSATPPSATRPSGLEPRQAHQEPPGLEPLGRGVWGSRLASSEPTGPWGEPGERGAWEASGGGAGVVEGRQSSGEFEVVREEEWRREVDELTVGGGEEWRREEEDLLTVGGVEEWKRGVDELTVGGGEGSASDATGKLSPHWSGIDSVLCCLFVFAGGLVYMDPPLRPGTISEADKSAADIS